MSLSEETGKLARLTISLPPDLYEKIAEKSTLLSAGLDQTIETLLRHGLAAQNTRESVIANLVEQLSRSESPVHTEELGNLLGETIFER